MIVWAGLDWLWWTLAVLGFGACVWVPTWMHGQAVAADAYADGWSDRETMRLGSHARQPGGGALELPPARDWADITTEWRAEDTADWMNAEARAELAAWVQEMTLRAS